MAADAADSAGASGGGGLRPRRSGRGSQPADPGRHVPEDDWKTTMLLGPTGVARAGGRIRTRSPGTSTGDIEEVGTSPARMGRRIKLPVTTASEAATTRIRGRFRSQRSHLVMVRQFAVTVKSNVFSPSVITLLATSFTLRQSSAPAQLIGRGDGNMGTVVDTGAAESENATGRCEGQYEQNNSEGAIRSTSIHLATSFAMPTQPTPQIWSGLDLCACLPG